MDDSTKNLIQHVLVCGDPDLTKVTYLPTYETFVDAAMDSKDFYISDAVDQIEYEVQDSERYDAIADRELDKFIHGEMDKLYAYIDQMGYIPRENDLDDVVFEALEDSDCYAAADPEALARDDVKDVAGLIDEHVDWYEFRRETLEEIHYQYLIYEDTRDVIRNAYREFLSTIYHAA